MASYFSRLSPVPSFPDYTGPYKVGTLDVEIPTAQVASAWFIPDSIIPTVSFHIFYPREQSSKPQQEFFKAQTRFLGASPRLSGLLQSVSPRTRDSGLQSQAISSYFFRYLPLYSLLAGIKIPALKNAKLFSSNNSAKQWPI